MVLHGLVGGARGQLLVRLAQTLALLVALDGVLLAAEVDRSLAISISEGVRTERGSVTIRSSPEEVAAEVLEVVVLLDFDRELFSAKGWCVSTKGKRKKVRRRNRDYVDYSGEALHSSTSFLVMGCPDALSGESIEVEWEVRGVPVFPGGYVSVMPVADETLKSFELSLQGPGLFWETSGQKDLLEEIVTAEGVRLIGRDIELDQELPSLGATLDIHYTWGGSKSWEQVAAWYRELLEAVPRAGEDVRAAARKVAEVSEPDALLNAVAELVQRDVRYVGVQVGIGGWQPTSPEEVWARRWGDCKDKTLLLIDLLQEVGIEAYPALARLDDGRRVSNFPSPYQFNHLVAAVRVGSLHSVAPTAPVVGDWLILDATQKRGGGEWLNPWVQGQKLLLVRESTGELIEAPVVPQGSSMRLEIKVDEDRRGTLVLDIVGSEADSFLEVLEVVPPEQSFDMARRLLSSMAGSIELRDPQWLKPAGSGLPSIRLAANISYSASVPLLPPELRWLPEPRDLPKDNGFPRAVDPGILIVRWVGPLGEGCMADEANNRETTTAIGLVRQQVRSDIPGLMEIVRTTVLDHRWIDDSTSYSQFRELSLAEHRMLGRSLRISCQDPGVR